MQMKSKQKGMAALQWLVVIAVAGFLMICGFTVMPAYINNWTVQAALESLQNERGVSSWIERTKSEMKISANYEARRHLLGNIDVVLVFAENKVTVPVKYE
jgi:hypothetical protein